MEKELSRRIDELIISCAIGQFGMGCDKAELTRLASEYGNVNDSYKLSPTLLAFESENEKNIALNLEKKVNDIIFQQRRFYRELGLGSHGSIFKTKTRKYKPRTPSPRTPSPRACSPKTRRSHCNMMGGKRRTRINSKRRRS